MTPAELIARIEASAGADRELDGDIHLLLFPTFGVKPWRRGASKWDRDIFFDDSDPHGHNKVHAERYTASVDAALTTLPDTAVAWWIGFGGNDYEAQLIQDEEQILASAEHVSLPHAILLAGLYAREVVL